MVIIGLIKKCNDTVPDQQRHKRSTFLRNFQNKGIHQLCLRLHNQTQVHPVWNYRNQSTSTCPLHNLFSYVFEHKCFLFLHHHCHHLWVLAQKIATICRMLFHESISDKASSSSLVMIRPTDASKACYCLSYCSWGSTWGLFLGIDVEGPETSESWDESGVKRKKKKKITNQGSATQMLRRQ